MSRPVVLPKSNEAWKMARLIGRRFKSGVVAVTTESYESFDNRPKEMSALKWGAQTIAANAFLVAVYFFCGFEDPDNFLPAPQSRAVHYQYRP